MTASNIVDASQQNGHASNHDKTPEEIQLEIARTRSAITGDLLALSERLSPQQLRESAREVMRDAREEAKDVLNHAKDAAFDSLRGVKDRALSSVQHTVTDIGDRARHASELTVSFVSAHRIAISLLGVGAGWLVWAVRSRRSQADGGEYAYRYEHYNYPTQDEARESRLSRARDGVRSVASRATRAVDSAREQVRRAQGEGGDSLRQRAGAGIRGAAGRSRTVAADNRLAVVGLTIAAGLGLGLLLPVGQGARRTLRETGTRLQRTGQRLRHDVQDRL